MEVRLLMKVEPLTLSEVTDIQNRLLPLTTHHPAEETSEAQKGWCVHTDKIKPRSGVTGKTGITFHRSFSTNG